MRIHATINERTLRRSFREQLKDGRGLTVFDRDLRGFGLRVSPGGTRIFFVRAARKLGVAETALGNADEMTAAEAREKAIAVIEVARTEREHGPLFRDFAARYRERRKHRWKPSSLEIYDIHMRGHLMPAFGRLGLDTIDHARVSAWFDTANADRPGAANRAFEILRAMLWSARQWGELGEHVPDACANIVKNPRRPVARYLDHAELERLGAVLDRHREEHPWPVAAIRLLTLTGARLCEILNLRWDEIGELDANGASARLKDSKTGPRTVWLGPEAVKFLAALSQEPAFLVREELREVSAYHAVLNAIAADTGLPERSLHYYLQQLANLGYIQRRRPLDGSRPNPRQVRYRIDDPLLRFWFRFVFPNQTYIRTAGPARAFRDRIAPQLDS